MPTTPPVSEWVKLVVDYGATVVISAVVIGLLTWAAVFVVLKLFGKNGIVPWAADRLLGDDGYVAQVTDVHNQFVASVDKANTDTKDMVKGALALSEVHLRKQKDTHEMLASCGEHFCDVLHHIGEKLDIDERIDESVTAIRRELERANRRAQ